jgi:hypothetical protein
VTPVAAAASQFPFRLSDLALLLLGAALIVIAATLARRSLALIETRVVVTTTRRGRRSAVAEGDTGGANRLRAVPEPAGGGYAGEQTERGRDRERVVHGGGARAAG